MSQTCNFCHQLGAAICFRVPGTGKIYEWYHRDCLLLQMCAEREVRYAA